MHLRFKNLALMTLVLSTTMPGAIAQSADTFWPDLSDTMTEVLLDEGDPGAIDRLLEIGTEIEFAVEHPRFVRRFMDDKARIDIFFDPRTEYTLDQFILVFKDTADVMIPAFRGSLSNCSEARPTDCKQMLLMSRSDFTLGVVSCMCEQSSWNDQFRGRPVAMVPCWLGRGATYLNVIFVFDDPSQEIDQVLRTGPSRESAAICAASDAARDFPEFLAKRHTEAAQSPPEGIEPNAWPIAVIAGNGDLQQARKDYGWSTAE